MNVPKSNFPTILAGYQKELGWNDTKFEIESGIGRTQLTRLKKTNEGRQQPTRDIVNHLAYVIARGQNEKHFSEQKDSTEYRVARGKLENQNIPIEQIDVALSRKYSIKGGSPGSRKTELILGRLLSAAGFMPFASKESLPSQRLMGTPLQKREMRVGWFEWGHFSSASQKERPSALLTEQILGLIGIPRSGIHYVKINTLTEIGESDSFDEIDIIEPFIHLPSRMLGTLVTDNIPNVSIPLNWLVTKETKAKLNPEDKSSPDELKSKVQFVVVSGAISETLQPLLHPNPRFPPRIESSLREAQEEILNPTQEGLGPLAFLADEITAKAGELEHEDLVRMWNKPLRTFPMNIVLGVHPHDSQLAAMLNAAIKVIDRGTFLKNLIANTDLGQIDYENKK